MHGGAGNAQDLIYGGSGDDSFWGEGGSDTLYGGAGQDTLEGDSGDDVLYSDSGDDDVYGGSGNDYIWIIEGTSAYIEGQSGDDTIDFSALGGTTVSSINFYGGSSTDGYVMFANGERLEFRSVENFIQAGDGTVEGTSGNDSMGAGYTDGQTDAIGDSDGSDNETIMGYGGNDTIIGGTGDDYVYGGAGSDSIGGGSGDDHVYGGSGDDYVYGDAGWDTLHSGDGNDTYYGGTGLDYIDFAAETSGVSVDLSTGTIGGAATGDVIGAGIDGVYGTNYDDTLTGFDAWSDGADPYTNVFFGRAGDDWMDGRGGPDWYFGGSGDDTFSMSGTPGDDVIDGGEAGSDNDVIDLSGLTGPATVTHSGHEGGSISVASSTITFGGVETIITTSSADTVTASEGGDTILSGAGDDSLTMNGGADSVAAGQGADIVYGGAGADSLAGDSGDDTLYGGSGGDVISGSYGADNVYGGTGNDTVLGGASNDTIEGGAGNDALYGGTGDDSLMGQSGDDNLFGGIGNDTIYGHSGDDHLYGGAGTDSLFGGTGNDSLYSASGDDVIYGASGDDYVTLTGMNLYALYGGEDPGDTDYDVLDISSLGSAGHVTSISYDTPDKEDGTIYFSNGDSATFSGFEKIVCFARGTRLLTSTGYRRVETLRPGDMLRTRDHGDQPLLWVGRKRVAATGGNAPVVVTEGTWGAHRPLKLSPQHRLLFTGWQAEVLFGEPEVLIPVKHLIDGRHIRQKPGGEVVYFHLCLERHEILCADGVAAESFLPGDIGLATLPPDQLEALYTALPALRVDLGAMTPARPCLKAYEVGALMDLVKQHPAERFEFS